MTLLEMLAVATAGLAAGAINAVVGSGTLVTFPVLLAVGLPPVTATISNSLGLVPATSPARWATGGAAGQRWLLLRLLPASVLGALTGAFLLLHLPASSFEAIVPALVGLAVVLVAVQPLVQRPWRGGAPATSRRPDRPRPAGRALRRRLRHRQLRRLLRGQPGVLQIGVFGLLLRESLQRLNAIKNVLTLAVNGVAAGAYVVVATDRVDWRAAAWWPPAPCWGGYLGARVGRRLPPARAADRDRRPRGASRSPCCSSAEYTGVVPELREATTLRVAPRSRDGFNAPDRGRVPPSVPGATASSRGTRPASLEELDDERHARPPLPLPPDPLASPAGSPPNRRTSAATCAARGRPSCWPTRHTGSRGPGPTPATCPSPSPGERELGSATWTATSSSPSSPTPTC
jgi:uncharacterized membrane protein YfcA